MRRSGPPALHFLAMGVALFTLERVAVPRRPPGPPPPPAAPLLTPDRLAQLRTDFTRGMLVTKMRLLAERREADPAPDDAALEAYLDLHADRYREPERTSLWHVFVSSARGTACERDARALLARLRADAMPTTAPLGDPFPFGAYVRAASPRELAQHFGEAFAAGVARLPVGEWAGPVASPSGLHLVRVEAREPGRVSPLAAVRARVLAEIREERRRERLAAAMAALRAKYGVQHAGAAQESRG